MTALLRCLIALMLLVSLGLASAIVARWNEGASSWAILMLLCALPLAFASLRQARWLELAATAAALLGLVVLLIWTRSNANWRVHVTIDRPGDEVVLHNEQGFLAPATAPASVPVPAINDVWRILEPDSTPCRVRWTNGSEQLEVRATLAAFFRIRPMHGSGERPMLMLSLWALCGALLLIWLRRFVLQWPPRGAILRSSSSIAMVFVGGVIVASAISPPWQWLNNEFLSRPDDWLCYEGGSRAMLNGNIFLMPPPGGVELWSLLYTPVVALLHVLLGPSTGPLYIVQFAAYLLLVPLFMRLAPDDRRWRALAATAALLFVLIDINLHYAWRLLSDVLPLLGMVGLFIGLRERWQAWSIGLLCGVLYLTRLELIALGPLVFAFFMLKDRTRRDRQRFLTAYFAIALLYFIRWWLIYGNIRPFPIAMEGTGHLHADATLSLEHITLMFRALLGDYASINPDLRMRWHWLPIHALFITSIVLALLNRRFDRMLLFALALFGYLFATRLLSPSVGIYGHRHSLALIALELVFIVLVVDRHRRGPTFAAQPSDRAHSRYARL
ncbi:MAG: hypothetical protein IPL52_02205 [Flavobacteriales bacterium]|nr:hypothetical protein [Flavobacteriales bacterium]